VTRLSFTTSTVTAAVAAAMIALTYLGAGVVLPGLISHAAAVTHNVKVARLTPSSTRRRGGSGGFAYNLSCPEGSVLVGIGARSGSLVDQVRGLCRRITNTGAWTGGEMLTGTAGGPGGSQRTRRCPSGFALSGFSGRASNVINQLRLECTRLGSNGNLNTSQRTTLSTVGGNGGTSFSTTRCSRPARSIVGKAGIYVDSFELACETNTPEMNTGQIDTALNGATNILRNDSGAGDVSCDVRVRRTGGVNIEPSNAQQPSSTPPRPAPAPSGKASAPSEPERAPETTPQDAAKDPGDANGPVRKDRPPVEKVGRKSKRQRRRQRGSESGTDSETDIP